jgi:hypothetical protein
MLVSALGSARRSQFVKQPRLAVGVGSGVTAVTCVGAGLDRGVGVKDGPLRVDLGSGVTV